MLINNRVGVTPAIFAIETVGWIGAAIILAAYLLLSAGRLTGQSRAYQWMNVVGAMCFVLNSGFNGAYPSAALNVVWAAIGVITLLRIARAGTGHP